MAAIDVPAWLGVPAWPLGLAIAGSLGGPGAPPWRGVGHAPARAVARLADAAVAGSAAHLCHRCRWCLPDQPRSAASGHGLDRARAGILGFPVLLAMLTMAVLFAHELRAWVVIVAGLASGAVGLAVVAVAPGESAIGAALTVELPQVIGLLDPVDPRPSGRASGSARSGRRTRGRLRRAWPSAGALVVAAAVPIRPGAPASPDQREHPYAETLANGSRIAEQGYWTGYPDDRRLVDADGGGADVGDPRRAADGPTGTVDGRPPRRLPGRDSEDPSGGDDGRHRNVGHRGRP